MIAKFTFLKGADAKLDVLSYCLVARKVRANKKATSTDIEAAISAIFESWRASRDSLRSLRADVVLAAWPIRIANTRTATGSPPPFGFKSQLSSK